MSTRAVFHTIHPQALLAEEIGAVEEPAQHESLGFWQPTYMPLNSSN